MRRWRGLACGLVWLGACGAPPFEAGVALDAVSPWEHAAVIGGRRTLPEDFPDTGAVRAHEALCSGTLIAPDVVLTAAHCHPQGGVGRGLFFDISKDLRESRPAHRHGVLEVAVHPGWRGHEVNLDAAEAHCGPAPGLLWVRRWLRCLSDLPAEVREQVGMDATERSTGHDLALLFLLRPHGG
ncbi:MAG TPA: trypsin-like serine protease, partial [Myxococcota bacterium]|nr:trypsin-like serine protease [Myxococcota bacterium]